MMFLNWECPAIDGLPHVSEGPGRPSTLRFGDGGL
jgi:hypothetical protein